MQQPSLEIARDDAPPAAPALLDELVRLSEDLHADYLEHYGVCPLGRNDDELLVATWRDAVDPQALDDLSLLFEARPRLIVLPERDVRTAIRRVYGSDPLTAEQLLADLPVAEGNVRPVDLAVDDLLSMANEAPVVRLVNMLLVEALDVGASDVHPKRTPTTSAPVTGWTGCSRTRRPFRSISSPP
jgi:type II secretory ATPase GspE/PulE/Tfp pilus assembly ATPase PilB-like protein